MKKTVFLALSVFLFSQMSYAAYVVNEDITDNFSEVYTLQSKYKIDTVEVIDEGFKETDQSLLGQFMSAFVTKVTPGYWLQAEVTDVDGGVTQVACQGDVREFDEQGNYVFLNECETTMGQKIEKIDAQKKLMIDF